MELTEIAPGLWVRADQVMAVRTTREHTRHNITLKSAVTIHFPHTYSEIGWEFDAWEDAMVWAKRVAEAINRQLCAPDEDKS